MGHPQFSWGASSVSPPPSSLMSESTCDPAGSAAPSVGTRGSSHPKLLFQVPSIPFKVGIAHSNTKINAVHSISSRPWWQKESTTFRYLLTQVLILKSTTNTFANHSLHVCQRIAKHNANQKNYIVLSLVITYGHTNIRTSLLGDLAGTEAKKKKTVLWTLNLSSPTVSPTAWKS